MVKDARQPRKVAVQYNRNVKRAFRGKSSVENARKIAYPLAPVAETEAILCEEHKK